MALSAERQLTVEEGSLALVLLLNGRPAKDEYHEDDSQVTTTTQDPKTSFRFLKLPYDVRYRIYCIVLVCPDQPILVTDLSSHTGKESNTSSFHPQPTSIFRTCKTIYHEAAPLYYSRNDFTAKDQFQLRAWLRGIGSMGRGNLQSLSIPLIGNPDLMLTYGHLREIDRLQNLTLQVKWKMCLFHLIGGKDLRSLRPPIDCTNFQSLLTVTDAMNRLKELSPLLKLRGLQKVTVQMDDEFVDSKCFLQEWKKGVEKIMEVTKLEKTKPNHATKKRKKRKKRNKQTGPDEQVLEVSDPKVLNEGSEGIVQEGSEMIVQEGK